MKAYLDMLQHVVDHGEPRGDRTGTGTRSVFGYTLRIDLQQGFPLLTTKSVHFKSVLAELLWMLSGSTNIKPLQEQGVRIWNEWADENGELGPVYGSAWRNFGGVDQIADVTNQLRNNPNSRRIIVSAWNPPEVPNMRLPPCHMMFQLYSHTNKRLDLQMYQRSADIFLGVPFNIASYALLLTMFARATYHQPGDLIIRFGDLHLYNNHVDQAMTQLSRTPRALPRLTLNCADGEDVTNMKYEDFQLDGYEPHPTIKAQVSV